MENTGVDCERTMGLARSVRVVRAPQINRRWIKERVLRFVRRRRGGRVGRMNALRRECQGHKADDRSCHTDVDPGCGFSTNHVQKRSLGSARVSRAGWKAWPLLRIRCSGVPPKQSFGFVDAS